MNARYDQWKLLLLLLLTLQVWEVRSDKLTVHLNHGTIRGVESVDENGNVYYAFKGIPYAEPPLNHLRFRLPVPKQPWDGILDTVIDGPACPQLSMLSLKYDGAEDNCLWLNVYTPQLPSQGTNAKLDVVFHIHGGGFSMGSGGEGFLYHPKRFMPKDQNVVLVSITYRVASIGFLSTIDSASQGNYGMLDQVEGLRWVRNNIDKFGGDPTKVTILGESAGGASVLYHVLSPLSKGLFRRAVAMSGTVLNPWAYQHEPAYWAKDLAKQAGCLETDDTTQLVECLRSKSAEKLINSEKTGRTIPAHLVYVPTVDHYFLPDTPLNMIMNKQYNNVPILTGVTRDEGNCWYMFGAPKPIGNKFTNEEVDKILELFFAGVTNVDKAVEKVREKYVSSLDIKEVYRSVAKVMTDGTFHKNHYQTVKLLAERGAKVYAYSYDYEGLGEHFKKLFNISADEKIGVCHGFELANFFTNPLFGQEKPTGENLQMKQQMQKLFFNFILNGTPNDDDVEVKWPQVEANKMHVYHINSQSSVSVYDESKDENYQFWVEEIPSIIGPFHPPSTKYDSHNEEL